MNKYNQFKTLMNSGLKKYSDEFLRDIWKDWHCQHEIFKRTYVEVGLNRNDRIKLCGIMERLGIPEACNLSGINNRPYPAYFNNENKSMFATMQNQIATKREYRTL